jgi:hypothetical protein
MTWHELCRKVMTLDEDACRLLLAEEQAGPARLRHMARIHSRINRLRAERERIELIKEAKS